MTVSRTYQLNLPEHQERQFDAMVGRIEEQFKRLGQHNVQVSPLAKELAILAVLAIVNEPSRKWPDFNLDDRVLMQESFVAALAYNFLGISFDVQTRERLLDIKFFDTVETIASNKWWECCLVTTFSQT